MDLSMSGDRPKSSFATSSPGHVSLREECVRAAARAAEYKSALGCSMHGCRRTIACERAFNRQHAFSSLIELRARVSTTGSERSSRG
eukprot:1470210-Pleurochrysis_carterae.AAC.1